MILVTAIAQRGVVGDGFHTVAFPAAKDNARFLFQIKSISLQGVCGCNVLISLPTVDGHGKVECREHAYNPQWVWSCEGEKT